MDTILTLDRANRLQVVERDFELSREVSLNFFEKVVFGFRKMLTMCCIGNYEEICNQEYDLLTCRNLKTMVDDTCDLSDLSQMYTLAHSTEYYHQDEQDCDQVTLNRVKLSAAIKRPWRRRRRVVSFCVIALLNHARGKYYNLTDTEPNRRIIGQYLLKAALERGMRASDAHNHVHYAVCLYFVCAANLQPSKYLRA